MTIGRMIMEVLVAFVATAAFSVLFNVPKKYYFYCGLTGCVSWGGYLLINVPFHTPIIAMFVSSLLLTMVTRYMAYRLRATTTTFLLCGIFTLVPGAGIYYTAYYMFIEDMEMTLRYGMDSLKIAVAIALGIGVAYSIPSRFFGWKKNPKVWKQNT